MARIMHSADVAVDIEEDAVARGLETGAATGPVGNGFYVRSMSMALAVLWAVRVVVQIVSPEGTPSAPLQYGMLTAFILLFLLFAGASFIIVDH
jgi:hypothetical protein